MVRGVNDEASELPPGPSSSSIVRIGRRARQQARWVRRDGVSRFIEEKELHPVARLGSVVRRARWRAQHGVEHGEATPVWVLGVQRSGTNLLMRSMKSSMEFSVYSENHRLAFRDFQLVDDARIRWLIRRSRHPYVLFKPLCDLDRAGEFWGDDFSPIPSKIIWAYRSVDGRVRSALSRFGPANLKVMRELGAGVERDRWQARGLERHHLDLVRSFDWQRESPASAAALFWYLRNDLLFGQGLHELPRVTIVSYERFVACPDETLERLTRFLELKEPLVADAGDFRSPARPPIEINPQIRDRCDELEQRLGRLLARAEREPGGGVVASH